MLCYDFVPIVGNYLGVESRSAEVKMKQVIEISLQTQISAFLYRSITVKNYLGPFAAADTLPISSN